MGGAGLLVVVCVIAAVADAGEGDRPAQELVRTQAGAGTLKPAPAGPLPPLPRVDYTPVRPMSMIQQVYEFAARHPEVLQYVPCYCGCERQGHRGNHDCFVKSRAADGRIIQWDEHGFHCAVCLEVGRRAMVLFNEKMSVASIRATIDREFGRNAPTRTPTPQPPAPRKS
jgi:hypothetical protein